MNKYLQKTQRKFVALTSIVAFASVLLLGVALYEANTITFSEKISPQDLEAAVADYPDVKAYLETEHQNEAHFITIANIIQNNQQKQLGDILLVLTIPVLGVSALLAYVVANRLMKPVEDAYEAQERFIADAAHELRNPLATMSVVVQNASHKKTPATKNEYSKYMLQIRRQLSRMVRINEDLLFLERNQDDGDIQLQNISELLQDVIEDLQPHALDRKLSFSTDIDENIIASIHPRDFVRLSKNLIENAIKYSKPTSRKVNVSLKDGKNHVILTVKDSGIGIPERDLPKIKERFFRARNAQKYEGSGLGLSIVQKIVEKYDGKFNLTSVENKGTTVVIEF
jgi:signal transduction histidine kinase